ncbi:hypothetical protein PENTCL1PPCAC_14169, partial [Pristionchus entomophagus]
VASGFVPILATVLMLAQLISGVKKGMRKSSAATRRYQQLAVRSLLLQGALPSLVYIIPSYGNSSLQMAALYMPELGDTFDRIG